MCDIQPSLPGSWNSWAPELEATHRSSNIQSWGTLGFLRRNRGKWHANIKKQAYISLVRSQLEYASVIWDPHRQNQFDQLEKIQRRAVHFVRGNYQREASVTTMREDICLPTLEDRRRRARLTMFYKVINNQIAIPIPDTYFSVSVDIS